MRALILVALFSCGVASDEEVEPGSLSISWPAMRCGDVTALTLTVESYAGVSHDVVPLCERHTVEIRDLAWDSYWVTLTAKRGDGAPPCIQRRVVAIDGAVDLRFEQPCAR